MSITRQMQIDLAVYTAGVERARRAYNPEPTIASPVEVEPHKGRGSGICERCGIDSDDLRGQKCPACTSYMRRRAGRLQPPRPCVECARPHRGVNATCGACRQQNYRASKKEKP